MPPTPATITSYRSVIGYPAHPPPGRSAAGDAHVARHGGAAMIAVDDEVVPLRLPANGFANRGLEQVVALRGAERSTEIRGIFLAEAHVERTGAGDADAIAAFAE